MLSQSIWVDRMQYVQGLKASQAPLDGDIRVAEQVGAVHHEKLA